MKNKICIVLLLICALNLKSCTSGKLIEDSNSMKELVYEDIANEIIRFHVIANSNTDEDQALKLKVRDKAIEFVSNSLKESNSLEESRKFIIENKSNIESIAKSVIIENGYDYNVTSSLSRENFPDKIYGDVVFPQGEYEAYRILIGEAKGENWWCVMFPPLCFVDGTKDAIDSTEVVEKLEGNNKKEKIKNNKIKFKFKLFEMLFEK
ncbi:MULTISPECIES: stage II sporulation protein R [unclassified Clostridium]|jgi:stage II sporulation protein R|uniref:stage II sporulation protein R n=1 Tax=unclassified Clostridium TaxID=2614128 RepID=UPI0025BA30CD|nr:stage II sporulation protein R [Clostridium sp.]MCI6692918.1 stage II sporulation protein R [Clostridium sp.]MDY4253357.1 stage II sporulation protein R [Clostridium sp.]MDY6226191.1 stage II sporulation protein R [Clostridium sp.]